MSFNTKKTVSMGFEHRPDIRHSLIAGEASDSGLQSCRTPTCSNTLLVPIDLT